MTAAETRLQERVAAMPLRPVPGTGRTWQVRSSSDPELWHTCRGGPGDTFESLTCSCQGGKGRCAHKVRLAWHLRIRVPEPSTHRTHDAKEHTVPATPPAHTDDNLATFEVYAPTRGNVRSEDADGEITLRLCVPGKDRAAIDTLLSELRSGGGRTVRLVPVWDGPACAPEALNESI